MSSKLSPRDFKSDRLPESPEKGKKACFESFRRGAAQGLVPGKRAQKATEAGCGLSSIPTQAVCAHMSGLLGTLVFLLCIRSNVPVEARYGGPEL